MNDLKPELQQKFGAFQNVALRPTVSGFVHPDQKQQVNSDEDVELITWLVSK